MVLLDGTSGIGFDSSSLEELGDSVCEEESPAGGIVEVLKTASLQLHLAQTES